MGKLLEKYSAQHWEKSKEPSKVISKVLLRGSQMEQKMVPSKVMQRASWKEPSMAFWKEILKDLWMALVKGRGKER